MVSGRNKRICEDLGERIMFEVYIYTWSCCWRSEMDYCCRAGFIHKSAKNLNNSLVYKLIYSTEIYSILDWNYKLSQGNKTHRKSHEVFTRCESHTHNQLVENINFLTIRFKIFPPRAALELPALKSSSKNLIRFLDNCAARTAYNLRGV